MFRLGATFFFCFLRVGNRIFEMENEIFWILLGKYLSREITEKERKVFQRLIQEDNFDLSYLIESLEEQWRKWPVHHHSSEERLNKRWDHLSNRISDDGRETEENALKSLAETDPERGRRWLPAGLKWAAIILLLFSLSYFIVRQSGPHKQVAQNEITVGHGGKKHIELPDGTSIWLNAGSKLTYDNNFAKNNRNVYLEGEALFDVEKNAELPFIVRTENILIKVLGTVFNVEAYPNEPNSQTTLISGKVQVSLNEEPGRTIVLSPHEKLTVNKNTIAKNTDTKRFGSHKLPVIPVANKLKYQVQTIPLNPIDSVSLTETAWVHGRLAFVHESFGEVAKQLERRYNVKITFEDKQLKTVMMSGIFKKETIDEALHVLQMITRFNYKINGDSMYIIMKK